jgi:hypothetical protein
MMRLQDPRPKQKLPVAEESPAVSCKFSAKANILPQMIVE